MLVFVLNGERGLENSRKADSLLESNGFLLNVFARDWVPSALQPSMSLSSGQIQGFAHARYYSFYSVMRSE
jgi:hypothetical protein